MNNSDLLEAGCIVIKDAFKPYFSIWLASAQASEIKGLKVILSVFKHKGKKRFRPLPAKEILMNSHKDIRQRLMQSYYKIDFSKESSQAYDLDILCFKRLSDLKYSEILTIQCLNYLENWIALKDHRKYQRAVLDCLKGLNSVINTYSHELISTKEAAFREFINEQPKIRSIRLEKKKFSSTIPTNNSRPQTRMEGSTKLNKTQIFYEPAFYQDRMKKVMRGSNGILNWVHDRNTSSYQNTYCPRAFVKTLVATPSKCSTVTKLVP